MGTVRARRSLRRRRVQGALRCTLTFVPMIKHASQPFTFVLYGRL